MPLSICSSKTQRYRGLTGLNAPSTSLTVPTVLRTCFCPDSTPLNMRGWTTFQPLPWTSPGADRLVQQPGLATVGRLTEAGNNLHRWRSRSWPWRQHAVRAYMGDYALGVIIILNMIIIASGLVDTIQPFTISLLLLHGLRPSYLVRTYYNTPLWTWSTLIIGGLSKSHPT